MRAKIQIEHFFISSIKNEIVQHMESSFELIGTNLALL